MTTLIVFDSSGALPLAQHGTVCTGQGHFAQVSLCKCLCLCVNVLAYVFTEKLLKKFDGRFVPVLLLSPTLNEAHNRAWRRALSPTLPDMHMAASSLVHSL